ncbi:MAG: hypothetical protein ACK4PI_11080 [Tepidisphaerales bacterium]
MFKLAALAAAVGVATPAMASIVVDGTAEAAYGPALAVQGIGTAFGNSNLGQTMFANGSELDAAYGVVVGSSLYLVLAGNLESNFNKLEIFIDSGSGGQNKLRGDNPDVDFNGLNRMGDDGSGNGLTFDSDFTANHFIMVTLGGAGPEMFANYAPILTGGGGSGTFLGGSGSGNPTITGALGINIAINNSNTAGVGPGTGADSGAGVVTGIELEIPLSLLAPDTLTLKISAFINGSGHDFLSNQVLGSLPVGTGNLGEPRSVNFANIDGNQYFTIVIPEPAALGLLAPMALLATRRVRRA